MGFFSSVGDAFNSVGNAIVDVAEDVGEGVVESGMGVLEGAGQMAMGDFQGGLSTMATHGPAGQIVGAIGGEDAQNKFGAVLGGAANVALQTGMGFAAGGPAGAGMAAMGTIMNDGFVDQERYNAITGDPQFHDGLNQYQQNYDQAFTQYGGYGQQQMFQDPYAGGQMYSDPYAGGQMYSDPYASSQPMYSGGGMYMDPYAASQGGGMYMDPYAASQGGGMYMDPYASSQPMYADPYAGVAPSYGGQAQYIDPSQEATQDLAALLGDISSAPGGGGSVGSSIADLAGALPKGGPAGLPDDKFFTNRKPELSMMNPEGGQQFVRIGDGLARAIDIDSLPKINTGPGPV